MYYYWFSGKFQDQTGQASCTDCGVGRYSAVLGASSSASCVACGQGKWSNSLAASSESTCIDCGRWVILWAFCELPAKEVDNYFGQIPCQNSIRMLNANSVRYQRQQIDTTNSLAHWTQRQVPRPNWPIVLCRLWKWKVLFWSWSHFFSNMCQLR